MKLVRLLGTLALTALLVPLSGCIGDEEKAPAPKVTGGSEIQEGAPPEKFTFEATPFKAKGEAYRETRTVQRGLPIIGQPTTEWRILFNFTDLPPLGVGEEGKDVGEVFYNVWVAKWEDEEKKETIIWELVTNTQQVASDGTVSGNTPWQRRYSSYIGVMLTLETSQDSKPEIPLLVTTEMEKDSLEKYPVPSAKTFAASFADARVTVAKDGKVNLTVNAFSLPETAGSYDVFLKNPSKTKYLGSLKFDAAVGGHSLSVSPDPGLFTKYQFYVALEQVRDKKEESNGFRILESRFTSK